MTSIVSKIKQPGTLLNHILDQGQLPAIVQSLDARTLTKLIRYVGLEDSAPIVSLATAEQLERVLDEDLWYSEAPGQDEIFDADRFGLWLEIMEETGSEFAARKVMELDENLVTLGLCRLVWVAGFEDAALRASDNWQPVDGNRPDKIWDSSPSHTFGSYRVIAKNPARWNAVFSLLVELNELDFDRLTRLLDRCRWISQEYIEENGGLFHVLSAGEMLAEDVSAERQERKEGRGFVTPTSAAVFLSQTRSATLKKIIAANIMDHGSRAYLKSAKAQADVAVGTQTVADSSQKGPSESADLKVRQFVRTLRDAEVLPASDLKMLSYGGAESWEHHLPLAKAMRFFNQSDPDLYSQRLTELSYLSNVLIAGCGFKGRTCQPQEAAEAAFSICNLGSEYLLKQDAGSREGQPIDPMTALLKRHHLVKLFQLGWKILFEHVVLYTAKAVSVFINHRMEEMADPDQVSEMRRMLFMLRYYILSGRPWEFAESMDYLQIFLDSETIAALTELLQEHPTLHELLCKKGGHRPSPFIWSQARIRTIRRFLRDAL